jgi:beta-glucosidase
MDSGPSTNDYARGYQVFVSSDGLTWGNPIATGAGTAALITVTFPTQTFQYIKIVQTGTTNTGNCAANPGPCYWWSIAEINVWQ